VREVPRVTEQCKLRFGLKNWTQSPKAEVLSDCQHQQDQNRNNQGWLAEILSSWSRRHC